MRMLAQNDPLEWMRRIGRLPHDDARTRKSLEKMSAPRRLQLPMRPTRPTAAAHALAPPLRITHGRRQRLPRILGEQQQHHRGEHLGVHEREVTQRISSGSRGLGQVRG